MTVGLLTAAASRGARMVSICSGGLRPRQGRAARRPDGHDALVAARRFGSQYPHARRPGGAVRRQRPGADVRRCDRRASTCACMCCARTSDQRSRITSPAASSWPRADIGDQAQFIERPPMPPAETSSRQRSSGCWPTCPSPSPSPRWPREPACRRDTSTAGSTRAPAPPPLPGCTPAHHTAERSCWRPPTCAIEDIAVPGWYRHPRPTCGRTSAGPPRSRPRGTAGCSRRECATRRRCANRSGRPWRRPGPAGPPAARPAPAPRPAATSPTGPSPRAAGRRSEPAPPSSRRRRARREQHGRGAGGEVVDELVGHPRGDLQRRQPGQELGAPALPQGAEIDAVRAQCGFGEFLGGQDPRQPVGAVRAGPRGQQVALTVDGDQADRVHRAPRRGLVHSRVVDAQLVSGEHRAPDLGRDAVGDLLGDEPAREEVGLRVDEQSLGPRRLAVAR